MSTTKISTPRSLLIGDPTSLYEPHYSDSREQSENSSVFEELNEIVSKNENDKKQRRISRSWSPPSPSWSRRDSMLALTELSTYRVSFTYPGTMKYQDMRKTLLSLLLHRNIFLFCSCSSLWTKSTRYKLNQNKRRIEILCWWTSVLSKICIFSMYYTKHSS